MSPIQIFRGKVDSISYFFYLLRVESSNLTCNRSSDYSKTFEPVNKDYEAQLQVSIESEI